MQTLIVQLQLLLAALGALLPLVPEKVARGSANCSISRGRFCASATPPPDRPMISR